MTVKTQITAESIFAMGATDAPEQVLKYPGMIVRQERNALYHLVLEHYQPETAILDAGIFFGASTYAICKALRERGVSTPVVEAFELGVFNRTNARKASVLLGQECKAGEAFENVPRQRLEAFQDLIKFHFGDITQPMELATCPVSIAFIDIVKNALIADQVVRKFFSRFIPHETVVIQQDYFDPRHAWIHFTMAAYPESFNYLGRPENSERLNTAVFRAAALDFDAMQRQAHQDIKGRGDVLNVFDRAVSYHVAPVEQFCVAGARAAAQAGFDLDEARVFEDFRTYVRGLGLAELLDDPQQQAHLSRIKTAIQAFARQRRCWRPLE